MITNKQDLKTYLLADEKALGYSGKKPSLFGNQIWKFQIVLRKHEYYLNTHKNKFLLLFYSFRHSVLGKRYGIHIPCNCFGKGLRINHLEGGIIINSRCHIGENCSINSFVNIGEGTNRGCPEIGDNVWIGPGVKMWGPIIIGSNVMIGANAAVGKSFPSNCRIGGVPAHIISNKGNYYFEHGWDKD